MSGSSTLPHSMTWAPQMTAGQFQSMQSLDQRGLPAISYYPIPLVAPSASMPYGLSSPYLLSPYPSMQLPRHTSEQQIPATNPNIPGSPPEGQDLNAYQLSLSLDQYNQHLIRSQLDQAQQTAQVASCQVQLLRDQLTSETTARIEAQSRTHQLLNANRELLEQVQALVLRLQSLEARLADEIQEHISQPSTSKGLPPSAAVPASAARVAAARAAPQMTTRSFHEQYTGEAKVPGPPPIDPSKPYQLQSLADIRAGSLPPQPAESAVSALAKNRRPADDSGIRTEPESGAEFEEEQQQITSPMPRRVKDKATVLGGEMMFNRMSFNPKLREVKRKDISESDNVVMESIEESQNEQPSTSELTVLPLEVTFLSVVAPFTNGRMRLRLLVY
ncbi:unnamed protein product [Gongylonema pulchrum]|uniref:Dystrophin-like protein 1 n=1 Tax=Gongylonema pulchrum TaxID=637853 RepID=A0A183E3L6_9BILA|nr:unnamed protein product [Gongylonema pulchrum]